ncbi:ribonuclease E [Neokomagataea thailandica NBRC 106555]|uniref:Ribonuclease E n=2 Tax=Neokomagataea TaxID=1223423 RepID=A0A4Y6V9S0_9PROT|nr:MULTISPECIES: ribonuclease E/G [Neokomagataea]QDH25351.1 Rne/Rng family ribonuclease [Neokomagataea tanensis]GBR53578.1 ribonuclease E [Neokomagataea thailandica NBRC 106555]
MNKRMLIDTTHAEETRVVVMNGDRVEDYDVETSSRKLLKGNIYLAKVIRVEPSLQAAFVDYGGNRHGFLAFSEIHPDYFQIPIADREKLLSLQEEDAASEAQESHEAEPQENDEDETVDRRLPEIVGGEHDTGEESAASRRTARFLRNYKIQEVIRRRQILLVQVVKEERGNKGAALTTYVSLAGRYCVLMPNALRGGGVSRKITSESDRRRLRDIIAELELPRAMAMIVRTAGAGRPGPEITRDCEYLLQLWDDIRSHALSSVAPTLIYEEANLIKRAIRDLFSKEIDDIMVDGENAWKSAREFMRLLMPHNTNKVKLWQNRGQSLFAHYNVEGHLDAMFSPTARLRSGGYLVINQTEALVSIDVNSGKSTSQRNIEETALRTNLEAAEEVGRQLRLRDLAGLIVIDFIDMESRRHNAQVEKRLKEALRSDRARIQVGHISHFGLLEMSRQRLRPSIAEAVLSPCPHCQGTGFVRGTDSSALHILRAIDEEGARQRASEIAAFVRSNIALYILNNKRDWLTDIETRHRMRVFFEADDTLIASDIRIERIKPQTPAPAPVAAPAPRTVKTVEIVEDVAPEYPQRQAYQPTPHSHEEHAVEVTSENDQNENEYSASFSNDGDDNGRNDNGRKRRRRNRNRNRNRRDYEQGDQPYADQEPVRSNSYNDEQPRHSAPARAPARPVENETTDTEAGLIPGRRRTRFKRLPKETDVPQQVEQPKQHFEPQEKPRQQERPQERPKQTTRAYVGPTPANPFGGSFDIFDVIEQAELSQSSRSTQARISKPIAIHERPAEQRPAPITIEPEYAVQPEQAEQPSFQHNGERDETLAPKRGRGRRRRPYAADNTSEQTGVAQHVTAEAPEQDTPSLSTSDDVSASKPRRTVRRRKSAEPSAPEQAIEAETLSATAEDSAARPRRSRARKADQTEAQPASAEDSPALQPINIDEVAPKKPRAGWWKR